MHLSMLLATLMLGCVSLFAQATGTVQGTVTDASGAVVPEVTILLVNTQSGFSRNVVAGPRIIQVAAKFVF